jgi:hypothetical protein
VPCGVWTSGQPPPQAQAPVQDDPRIAAIIVYLCAGQVLSKKRTAQALAELFGISLSSGTVTAVTARRRAARWFPGGRPRQARRSRGRGIRRDRAAGGGQAARGALRPHQQVHAGHLPSEAREGGDGRDGGPAVLRRGRRPRRPAPYDTYPGVTRQLCAAHAQRERQAVTDVAPAGSWCWAAQAAEALAALQKLVSEAAGEDQDAAGLARWPPRPAATGPRS